MENYVIIWITIILINLVSGAALYKIILKIIKEEKNRKKVIQFKRKKF